LKNIGFNFWY